MDRRAQNGNTLRAVESPAIASYRSVGSNPLPLVATLRENLNDL
jgi:hypothetical protein